MQNDMPSIGDLRHRIILENLDEMPGPGPVLSRRFLPMTALWAAITPEKGGGAYHLGKQVGPGKVIFTVRAAPFLIGIDRLDRWLRWPASGRHFRLVAVRRRDPLGRFLDLEAVEEERELPADSPAPGDADDNPA